MGKGLDAPQDDAGQRARENARSDFGVWENTGSAHEFSFQRVTIAATAAA